MGTTRDCRSTLGKRRSARSWFVAACMAWVVTGAVSTSAAPSFENPHGELSISCSECHSTEGWTPLLSPLVFDHSGTGFPLDAGHRRVECASCHAVLEFNRVASACADCHLDPHLGELGFECASCHESTG